MSDRYSAFATSSLGRRVIGPLGLPNPTPLRRHRSGEPALHGPALFAAAGQGVLLDPAQSAALAGGVDVRHQDGGPGLAPSERPAGLVLDASGIEDPGDLVELHRFFAPTVRSLLSSGRVVVLARPPQSAGSVAARVAQRALEGFTRSLGKEVGRGSTVNMVHVAPGGEQALASTLLFLLSARSAYVSGQVLRVGPPVDEPEPSATPAHPDAAPLAGRVVVVTGASRGIGASMVEVLTRDGATVVGVDVPAAASDLARQARESGGSYLPLDVTAVDAAQRLARHTGEHHGGLDVVVHNAGITRDKRLANMKPDAWSSTLAVNLQAPLRITERLLADGAIRRGGRVVGVSSIAGIAGNLGQTNYATSKAGVVGLVEALAPRAAESGVTVNAVAPGFIETQMTAVVPLVIREAGRRMNSLSQGGQPVDVAEAVAWLAQPGSGGVNGTVTRVCGQSLLGA